MNDDQKQNQQEIEEQKEVELNEEEMKTPAKEEIDYKDKYTRLLAEYSNFAKQKEAELQATAKFANKNLITKILDILDDIESATNQEQVSDETKSLLNIVNIKLQQLLAYEGVIEIEIKEGDNYDAEKCEVVTVIEDQKNAGKIIQILRKGYTISDRILRTAKVIVGK
jgi:molecular chaperone GrpE